jgi:hypothetical protein
MPTTPQFSRDIIEAAIAGLEVKKQTIATQLVELRQLLSGDPSATASSNSAPTSGGMSAASRARIAEAQRKRWAAIKKADETPAKKKRKLSPEGRQRIIDATKRRWALARAAKSKNEK